MSNRAVQSKGGSDFALSNGFQQAWWNVAKDIAHRESKLLVELCESPIEIEFATAFLLFAKLTDHWCCLPTDTVTSPEKVDRLGLPFDIYPQTQIEDFRVDFLIGHGARVCIVECDGREYHHIRREQIERDRARDAVLAQAGYKVFRFPGAEIYAEPFMAVVEVMRFLKGWEE